ncbi:riboflavin synthase [Anaerococcus sp. AGMB09787]|uniref:riboflavin synthase n=1 Tax=Anaerococcus sp. AGMB09787 TaxID=2922869 RepID=UPI001FAF7866|nr:riboflavin synthase [Anaerococcus sp. AGMB09787]
MFTGIAKEVGEIKEIRQKGDGITLTVKADEVLKDLNIGDSIMTDGVCLTVVSFSDGYFRADMMRESLRSTKFDQVKKGAVVNLERALRFSDRLDGHLVQGHVDGLGRIIAINKNVFRISASEDILKYVVRKGSVCLDGISLTVSFENTSYFEVSLIPETLANTNFKYKKVNDLVNIETDIIMRALEKLSKREERLDKNFLLSRGF